MEIKEINDKNVWESFLARCQEKTFLQSWNWGEFQKIMGNKIWRLGVFKNHRDLILVCLATKIMAKRGTFLLIQHLPIFNFQFLIFKNLIEELKKIAKEEKCDFVRIAPLLERSEENKKIFHNLGFRKSPMHANAYEATWKLDITPSEEELLGGMRKTTRYLIRQAQKNPEIEIVKSDKIEDVELYQKLNEKVSKYQRFTPFSFDFVKNEFKIFTADNQALLFFGKYKGEVISSALIIFWQGIGFYHQAALDPDYHKIPIAYLLQWEAIKEAKKRDCKLYDFWGYVDPKKEPRHPWAGPTLFKMGFGGKAYQYLKTHDFPVSKKYWLTFIFEQLRKLKRGL